MSSDTSSNVTLTHEDADAWFTAWVNDSEDILARAAFDRMLRSAAGIEDEGLYFRPGGWQIDLPATVARIACAAAVLAASFQLAGLEDVDREIIIAAAGLIAAMDLRPVRPGRAERRLADRVIRAGLAEAPLTAAQARKTLTHNDRKHVSNDDVANALDNLVAAGLADRSGPDEWTLRAPRSPAWIRLSLHGRP